VDPELEVEVVDGWTRLLTRWTDAGVIDEETAARIRAFEMAHSGSTRLRWPIWIALVFGALMLGAGVLLFVSAHWDTLSPETRFVLVLTLVAVFHVGGALTAERFPEIATALHAVGTVTLGAGIYLTGQIFNLDEHWPSGLLLWAAGAAIAWALLQQWPQLALIAILVPAWLSSEWIVAIGQRFYLDGAWIPACGHFLLALAYFSAVRGEHADTRRKVLLWIGAISMVPAGLWLAFFDPSRPYGRTTAAISPTLRVVGWAAALGLPLLLAIVLRRKAAWPNAVAIVWVLVLINLRPLIGEWSVYLWWAIGAIGLAAWGVQEARSERINVGAAIFALTVLTFYFSQVMDKLGRSASLVGFGLLFLAGGWCLERARRLLVLQMQRRQA
jgi:uncharacterized membrane protein